MEEHAVVLERERPLRPRRRRAPAIRAASGEAQYASTKRADPRQLLVGHAPGTTPRTCSTSGGAGRAQVDELEQPVDGVADLGRGEARLARAAPSRASAGRIPATRSA